MKKSILILAALLLITAGPAKAADERFERMDTNKDNSISWEEFSKAYPGMQRHAFDAIDLNKDGKISLEEWEAFRKTHSMGGQGMGGQGGMGGMGGMNGQGMGGQGMGGMNGQGMGGGMGGKMMPPDHPQGEASPEKPLITPPPAKQ